MPGEVCVSYGRWTFNPKAQRELEVLLSRYGFKPVASVDDSKNGRRKLTFEQEHANKRQEDSMIVQEIRSTGIGEILEFAKGASILGLPFELKAEVQTKVVNDRSYRSLLYTLYIEAVPRGAVSSIIINRWRVEE